MTSYNTIIDCVTLAANLESDKWAVVDCRFDLADTDAGLRAYKADHIPHARYAHLDENLSGPITDTSGRHPLPGVENMVAQLSAWGIDRQTQVVVYDDAGGAIAARLWWLLRWLGSDRCAVLDGGFRAWTEAGLPLSTIAPSPTARKFVPAINDKLWLNTAAVAATIGSDATLLIDARAGARFRGEHEPLDPVAGHVPGAINLPLTGNLQDGRFRSADALLERYQTRIGDRQPAQVVHMCGSGVTACHNMLAMEIAGLRGSRIYPGSWSEWLRDPERPVATGD